MANPTVDRWESTGEGIFKIQEDEHLRILGTSKLIQVRVLEKGTHFMEHNCASLSFPFTVFLQETKPKKMD